MIAAQIGPHLYHLKPVGINAWAFVNAKAEPGRVGRLHLGLGVPVEHSTPDGAILAFRKEYGARWTLEGTQD